MRRSHMLPAVLAALLLGAPAAQAGSFQSPSKNIGCFIDRSGVRCDIAKRSWSPPPKPSSCNLDYGQGVSVGRRGRARYVCAGDTALGSGPRLAYGRSIRRGRFRCTSRRSGMRCANLRTGHGFTLARDRVRLF